jgi:hypothetical protein
MPRVHSALLLAASFALSIAGCSDAPVAESNATGPDTQAGTASAPAATATAAPAPVNCDSYTDSLTNRDWAILYYGMTGLTPPREKWADEALTGIDRSLGAEEAWKRANAQVESQWNAVKDIRCVTLRTRAAPQAYDATLGGMPLGAFAPDAFYPFRDGSLDVSLKFRNADKARIWKMTADKAAALKADSWLGNLGLAIRVRLIAARPSGNGGTIEGEIVGFDLEPSEYSRIDRETVTVTP